MISPDWSREKVTHFWQPNQKLINAIRDYQRYTSSRLFFSRILSKLSVVRYIFWSSVSGADIPLNTLIGGGLLIPHPNGIVIHPDCEIGMNCLIHQQVTIGVKSNSRMPPKIGNHVDIGAGAKIIGSITVGDYAVIGANAVVTKDVSEYSIVAGIPAKVIGKLNQDNSND